MALPIQPTPVLKGKEAEAFYKKAKANEKKSISMDQLLKELNIVENFFEEIKNGNNNQTRSR